MRDGRLHQERSSQKTTECGFALTQLCYFHNMPIRRSSFTARGRLCSSAYDKTTGYIYSAASYAHGNEVSAQLKSPSLPCPSFFCL